jgi:hypothetical protein
MDVLSDMITTINLIIVGVSLFSYFAFTSPEPCPRKYRVLQEDGGILTITLYQDIDVRKWV